VARDFDGSADYFYATASPLTAYGGTMACWFYADDLAFGTADKYLMSLADTSVATSYVGLLLRDADSRIACGVVNSGWRVWSGPVASTGVWSHAAATFTGPSDISAYLNADSTGSVIFASTPTWPTLGSVSVGALRRTSVIAYFDGRVAEPAIWNVVLTQDELGMLAAGFSPLMVRPQNLVFYAPLFGRAGAAGNEDAWVGSKLTQVSSPGLADHPRIIYPRRRGIVVPVSAGGGGAITIDATTGNAVAAGVTGVAGVAATINGVVGNATAAGITGTVSVDLSIAGVVGNAVAAGVTGAPAVGISIDGVLGNAVAAGVSGVPGVSIEIAGTVGNAVAAGVAGLAEVGGSISIDGVVGNAVAAGVAGSPGVAITITGNVGNAVAAGVSGLAAIGILIDGVVGNATAAGVTGGLSLDIVVVGVVGNAAAAGVTGAVSLSGGSGADPADVWAYELAPGVSAGQYVTEIHAMLTTLTGGSVVLPVNVKQVNDKIIYGNGIPGSDVFRVTP
jgi:hypothetical protein